MSEQRRVRSSRRLRAIAFAWACAACTSGVEQREQETAEVPTSAEIASIEPVVLAGLVSIPLRSRIAPIVEVSIDSGEPALFLLDTGATFSSVSSEQARRWKLDQAQIPPVRTRTPAGLAVIDRTARLPGITLGDWTLPEFEVPILELPMFAGVVGLDVLHQRAVLVDGPRGCVIVAPQADPSAEALRAAYPGRTWTALRLTIARQTCFLEASIGVQPLRLFLDTGSSNTTLSSTMSRLLGAEKTGSTTFVEYSAAGTREVEVETFQLPRFSLGPYSVDAEAAPWVHSPGSWPDQGDGILGFDILAQVPFIFDARAGRLWILDPLDGAETLLVSTVDQRRAAVFRDPLPAARILVAKAAASLDSREWLHELAALLDDEVAEVREAAVESLSTIAGVEWSGPDRIDQAKKWCKAQPLEGADSPDRGD